MRRAVLVTAILMIVFLMAALSQMVAVRANPYHEYHIEVYFPSYCKTYTDSTVDIEVRFSHPIVSGAKAEISYSIDDSENKTLDITSSSSMLDTAKGTLYNLTNGSHSLKVYAGFSGHAFLRSAGTFLVDTSFTYPTFLQSPRNITYNSKEVPLEFITNQTWDQWGRTFKVQYTLDKSYEVSTEAKVNTTITGLTDGQHKIIVDSFYFIPSIGTSIFYSTKTIYFTIDTSPTPTPTVPEFPSGTLLLLLTAVTSTSLMVYHKKHKSNAA
jgi:hypothetical protein